MTNDHELLLSALLSQLGSNQASVRKKTVSCIGKTQMIKAFAISKFLFNFFVGCSCHFDVDLLVIIL